MLQDTMGRWRLEDDVMDIRKTECKDGKCV
jgi:hypothetical protein